MDDNYVYFFMKSIFGELWAEHLINVSDKTVAVIKKNLDTLPEKSRIVLDALARGTSRKEISKQYGFSYNVIKYWERKGLRMLKNPSRARELVQFIDRSGLGYCSHLRLKYYLYT